ncbi:hypothetical protein AB0N17_20205 [Streptomyces sp. NPDC051133]|uniref:hypothetical protein n=1 Tax=Streptomyces sp. NPDC051133 TaxID=3155521 RepID=UPI0034371C46
MPWFVVDDNADTHPKMIAATNAALGLWLKCGAYAARHLTDGIVPGAVAKMYGSAPQIKKLTAAGLWHTSGHDCSHPKCLQPAAGDFVIHDYLVYNPSRRDVLAKRERAAAKKRKQRAVQDAREGLEAFGGESHENRGGFDDDPDPNHSSEYDDPAGRGGASPRDSRGTRTRATPSPPLPSHQGGADREPSAGGRGRDPLSLIAADWQPSDEDVAAAQLARADAGREQLTPQQIGLVTRKFRQRMLDDQVRAAGFGGRWQQWAENERTEQPAVGGNVVHLPAMTRGQQQRAGLDRLAQQLDGGHTA